MYAVVGSKESYKVPQQSCLQQLKPSRGTELIGWLIYRGGHRHTVCESLTRMEGLEARNSPSHWRKQSHDHEFSVMLLNGYNVIIVVPLKWLLLTLELWTH